MKQCEQCKKRNQDANGLAIKLHSLEDRIKWLISGLRELHRNHCAEGTKTAVISSDDIEKLIASQRFK